MISKSELENAIKEYEDAPNTYSNCEKLVTFYTLYDKLYGERIPVGEEVVSYRGKSEFAENVGGTDPAKAWAVMDELMDALSVLNPKLYQSALEKVKDLQSVEHLSNQKRETA